MRREPVEGAVLSASKGPSTSSGRMRPKASLLVAACRRSQPEGQVPVWFMRQAGRSLPEYREVRDGIGMLESCGQPDLVAEITLQPVRRYGVDAAIFYSDIMVPLRAAGVELEIVSGQGPIIDKPVRRAARYDGLFPIDQETPEQLAEVAQRQVLVISLDDKGGFFQGGEEEEGKIITPRTPVPDLAAFLQEAARTRGAATSVRLDAARNVPFQQVIDALDICSLQGFENVGIRIQHTGKEFYELGDRRSLGLPPSARKATP